MENGELTAEYGTCITGECGSDNTRECVGQWVCRECRASRTDAVVTDQVRASRQLNKHYQYSHCFTNPHYPYLLFFTDPHYPYLLYFRNSHYPLHSPLIILQLTVHAQTTAWQPSNASSITHAGAGAVCCQFTLQTLHVTSQDGSSLEFVAATAGRECNIQDARGRGLWLLHILLIPHQYWHCFTTPHCQYWHCLITPYLSDPNNI